MPRAAQDKAYRTFAAGFITEATGVSFPENSCRDIDNCDLELKGTARRRLGLNEEPGGTKVAQGYFSDTAVAGSRLSGVYSALPSAGETCLQSELAVTSHPWTAPGDDPSKNFMVFQVGNTLIVRDWDGEAVSDPGPISLLSETTTIDLSDEANGDVYTISHIAAAKLPLQSAPGFGRLWFTGQGHKPFYLEFVPEDRLIVKRPVGYEATSFPSGRLAIRDFNGVDDGLKVDEQPTTLSAEHRYNLFNQGWSETRVGQYFGALAKYPSNAQQWLLGKNADDDFDPGLLNKQEFGNSPAPKGRNILDALEGKKELGASAGTDGYDWGLYRFCRQYRGGDHGMDYRCAQQPAPGLSSISLTTLVAETATTSFRAVAFFSQRVWFAGETNGKRPGGVYFSKTLSKPSDAGLFMQENDPTSEHFSDLLATDGGVIYLPEANTIERLVPFGTGILAMARNGIWFIYGGDNGFTATAFTIEKVSVTGVISGKSVVQADDKVVFFAENGIHALALPERGVVPQLVDISNNKIYSFYAAIPRAAREQSHGAYDTVSKKVFWSYLDAPSYSYPQRQSLYNRMLVLDIRTGAFTKYSFTINLDTGFGNGPMFPKRTPTRPQYLTNVVVAGHGSVVYPGGDVVAFVDADTASDFLTSMKVLLLNGPGEGLHIGEFYDTNFRDYRTMVDHSVQDYTSYLITGDEVLGDLQRDKQATYIHNFFQRTETGFDVSTDGPLVARNPSGCYLTARWDWHNTAAGGRWSDPQRAYRYRRPHTPVDGDDPYDTGEEIVYTKLKIRGKGRALTVKYESVPQTDFQLLGYSVAFTGNGV